MEALPLCSLASTDLGPIIKSLFVPVTSWVQWEYTHQLITRQLPREMDEKSWVVLASILYFSMYLYFYLEEQIRKSPYPKPVSLKLNEEITEPVGKHHILQNTEH